MKAIRAVMEEVVNMERAYNRLIDRSRVLPEHD
jgi:hypothetical protein